MLSHHDGGSRTMSLTAIPSLRRRGLKRTGHQYWPYGMWHENAISHPPREADREKAQALPAGSFFALSPDHAHYFFADKDTVIQLNSTGPLGITYINPKD